MEKMTITEGLAEIKTLKERIAKKRNQLKPYVVLDGRLVDPMKEAGGSAEHIKRERQAIADMETRYLGLRVAIQKANLATLLAIEGREMSVAEWLVWRKEIEAQKASFLQMMFSAIHSSRDQVLRTNAGASGTAAAAAAVIGPMSAVVNVDEVELTQEIDQHTKITGALDGRLSLINATTMIEVD